MFSATKNICHQKGLNMLGTRILPHCSRRRCVSGVWSVGGVWSRSRGGYLPGLGGGVWSQGGWFLPGLGGVPVWSRRGLSGPGGYLHGLGGTCLIRGGVSGPGGTYLVWGVPAWSWGGCLVRYSPREQNDTHV